MEKDYEIDPKDSWMVAAAEKNIPIVVAGWEDSTMGNIFSCYIIKDELKATTVKSGIEYMVWLADWYGKNSQAKALVSSRSVAALPVIFLFALCR